MKTLRKTNIESNKVMAKSVDSLICDQESLPARVHVPGARRTPPELIERIKKNRRPDASTFQVTFECNLRALAVLEVEAEDAKKAQEKASGLLYHHVEATLHPKASGALFVHLRSNMDNPDLVNCRPCPEDPLDLRGVEVDEFWRK